MPTSGEMTCQEVVELVTDYLENALSIEERQRFEAHLKVCRGCRTYLEQMRETISITGTLKEETISSEAREELLRIFRNWKRPQPN